jgi:hypothetical protein
VRCGRCGNENSETNRFCGMCGAPLVPQSQAASAPAARGPASRGPSGQQENTGAQRSNFPAQPGPARATAQAPAAGPAASASGGMERSPVLSSFDVARDDELDREPIISGPSFLGLNKPGAGRGRFRDDGRGGGQDLLRSSGNVDYLLEDEGEPKRGWGKLFLVLLALVLAGGFGYLRWRQGGFDWLKTGDRKQAAAQAGPDAGQNGTDSGGSGTAGTPGTAAGGGAVPAGAASAAGGNAATPTENTTTAPQTSGVPAAPAQASAPQNSARPNSSPQAAVPAAAESENGSQANSSAAGQASDSTIQRSATAAAAGAASQVAASQNGGSDSAEQSSDSDEEPAAPKTVARKPAAKPVATKPSAAKPIDTVAEAERYVYGSSGVRQDCDRGLRMLKGAAGQSDAKAMISLGALYTTGTCAPRDLPTAYRWFALALHKQPDNQALQDDLQKLWSQMTQPERQLAIKLSQ